MHALAVEMSIAEGEQALQALLQFAREHAGTLEAHEAEQGIVTRRLPIGVAAMQRYFAQHGMGDVGPAVTRADGVRLPREQTLRGRDSCSLFGTFQVARTCDRTPGAPGGVPLDAQVNLPERCDSYVLQEWMTVFAVEHPFRDRAGFFAQLFDLDVAERVVMEVAQEAPEDDEGFSAQRPVPPEERAGALLVVSGDGQGVPMIQAEAVKLTATWDTGRGPPRPAGPAGGARGADEAAGDGAHQGRRGAPGAPASTTGGRVARWGPRPVDPGDHARQARDTRDVCRGQPAHSATLIQQFFDKVDLHISRLFVFAAFFTFAYTLLTVAWMPINRVLSWLLLPLGQNALMAYTLHLFVVALTATGSPILTGTVPATAAQNTLIQTAGIILIWAIISLQPYAFAMLHTWYAKLTALLQVKRASWALSSQPRNP